MEETAVEDMKIKDILKVGEIVKTKHCQSEKWVTNIVLDIDDQFIEIDIGIEKDYIENLVMIGDAMKIKYTTNEREYTLSGWITNIKPDFPQKLTMRIHKIDNFQNLREHYRHDIYLCSVIKKTKADKTGVFAVMINISSGGAAFTTKNEMGIDDERGEYYFEIFISSQEQLEFKGAVARKSSAARGVEYGVKIIEINDNNRKIMDALIERISNEDKEFYNKKNSF